MLARVAATRVVVGPAGVRRVRLGFVFQERNPEQFRCQDTYSTRREERGVPVQVQYSTERSAYALWYKSRRRYYGPSPRCHAHHTPHNHTSDACAHGYALMVRTRLLVGLILISMWCCRSLDRGWEVNNSLMRSNLVLARWLVGLLIRNML